MNNDFGGKVALVAGAASGTGLATAQAFAGAMVAQADKPGDAARDAAAALVREGYQAIGIACDVTWEADVREIADAVLWLCGPGSTFVIGHGLVVDGGYTVR